jgi:hypothetical protein
MRMERRVDYQSHWVTWPYPVLGERRRSAHWSFRPRTRSIGHALSKLLILSILGVTKVGIP